MEHTRKCARSAIARNVQGLRGGLGSAGSRQRARPCVCIGSIGAIGAIATIGGRIAWRATGRAKLGEAFRWWRPVGRHSSFVARGVGAAARIRACNRVGVRPLAPPPPGPAQPSPTLTTT